MPTPKLILLIIGILITIMQSCSGVGPGFGGYDRPSKSANKYYSKHFDLTHKDLIIAKAYKNANALSPSDSNFRQDYFVFYANGFVLHNSTQSDRKKDKTVDLDYRKIHGEDVGSYTIKGDTIFWGTKAGYMKDYNYYSAIITAARLVIISQPAYQKFKYLTL